MASPLAVPSASSASLDLIDPSVLLNAESKVLHQFKELLTNHIEQVKLLGSPEETESHIYTCSHLISVLSSKHQCNLLNQLVLNFTDYFNQTLLSSSKYTPSELLLAKKEAELCKQLISQIFELLFTTVDYKNQSHHVKSSIETSLESWNRLINHFLSVINLSSDLQERIECIAQKNLNDKRDYLILSNNPQSRQHFNSFKEQLELLFGNRFIPLTFLGKGASKIAYLAYETTTQTVSAISIHHFIPNSHQRMRQVYSSHEKEFALKLSGLPGIIQTSEVAEIGLISPRRSILQAYVQEFMDHDLHDLVTLLINEKPLETGLDQLGLETLTIDLIASVATLEQQDIVHMDIRADNFLCIIKNNRALLKLIDFGFTQSKHKPRPFLPYSNCIDMAINYTYKPPESITIPNQCTSSQFDTYSLGLLLFKMYINQIESLLDIRTLCFHRVSSNELFRDKKNPSLHLRAQRDPDWFPNHPLPAGAKDTIVELIWQMLQFKPEDRPTPIEALAKAQKIFAVKQGVSNPIDHARQEQSDVGASSSAAAASSSR